MNTALEIYIEGNVGRRIPRRPSRRARALSRLPVYPVAAHVPFSDVNEPKGGVDSPVRRRFKSLEQLRVRGACAHVQPGSSSPAPTCPTGAQEVVDRLDAEVLRRVEVLDPDGALIRIVRHATSADVTGEYEEVVGYGAAVLFRRARAARWKREETP